MLFSISPVNAENIESKNQTNDGNIQNKIQYQVDTFDQSLQRSGVTTTFNEDNCEGVGMTNQHNTRNKHDRLVKENFVNLEQKNKVIEVNRIYDQSHALPGRDVLILSNSTIPDNQVKGCIENIFDDTKPLKEIINTFKADTTYKRVVTQSNIHLVPGVYQNIPENVTDFPVIKDDKRLTIDGENVSEIFIDKIQYKEVVQYLILHWDKEIGLYTQTLGIREVDEKTLNPDKHRYTNHRVFNLNSAGTSGTGKVLEDNGAISIHFYGANKMNWGRYKNGARNSQEHFYKYKNPEGSIIFVS